MQGNLLNKSIGGFFFRAILISLFVCFLIAWLIILMLRIKISILDHLAKKENTLAFMICMLDFSDESWENRGIKRGSSKRSGIVVVLNASSWVAVLGISWIII